MPNSPKRASLPSPPDLSDPKWQEYVRKSGLLLPMETSPHLQHTRSRSPVGLIPEFAHLAVDNDATLKTPQSNRFVDKLPPPSPSPHLSSNTRRYAKTPVFRIGQLEDAAPSPPPPLPLPMPLRYKASDVEPMAEQYRNRLNAGGCENLKDGDDRQDDSERDDADAQRQNSIETIRSAITRRKSPPVLAPPRLLPGHSRTPPPLGEDSSDHGGSPTSDGTLVDFEEDAIYFKPAFPGFTPEGLSPIPEDGTSSPFAMSAPPRPDALSLQICVDLLTRELASALRRNQPRPSRGEGRGAKVPSLEVWLMIEAYEKLRDQVLDMRLPMDQERALEEMLGTWLGALYKVHEDLAGGETSRGMCNPSEGEVEALQTVELDQCLE